MINVLFYISAVCFIVALLAWSVGELLRAWQVAIGLSMFFAIGTLALCVRTFLVSRQVAFTSPSFYVLCILCVFCLTSFFIHALLMRTMILPTASVLMVVMTILEQKMQFHFMENGLYFSEPLYWWGTFSIALLYVGLGVAGSTSILGLICLWRRGKNVEDMHSSIRAVTLKAPVLFSKLGWLVLFLLVMAIGSYMMYCRMLTGNYWQWQPLYAGAVVVVLSFGIGKHLSIHR